VGEVFHLVQLPERCMTFYKSPSRYDEYLHEYDSSFNMSFNSLVSLHCTVIGIFHVICVNAGKINRKFVNSFQQELFFSKVGEELARY